MLKRNDILPSRHVQLVSHFLPEISQILVGKIVLTWSCVSGGHGLGLTQFVPTQQKVFHTVGNAQYVIDQETKVLGFYILTKQLTYRYFHCVLATL